jgi:predicted phosphodiesterase
VRGNCDSNFEWPLVLDLARGGLRFHLQHVPPDRPPDDVDVLLHGHTHVPRNERRGRVLFLNPGCVNRPNRGSPPSVAWLQIMDGKINWKLVPLRCSELSAGRARHSVRAVAESGRRRAEDCPPYQSPPEK